MKKLTLVLLSLWLLAAGSPAKAGIVGATYGSDGDGAILCTNWTFTAGAEAQLGVQGNQFGEPAHINATFFADSPEDPTVTLYNAVENDTSFLWTGYHLNVAMGNSFTISSLSVSSPTDWTWTITSQPVLQTDGRYVGQIDLLGGTPVDIGQSLAFSYKVSFVGSTSYSLTQEFVPVPEPGTFSLLALGGSAWLLRRRKHA